MATLLDMRARVKGSLGNKSNKNDDVDNAINEAMWQLVWELKPHEATDMVEFDTTDGVYEYNFTDDLSDEEMYAPFLVFDDTRDSLLTNGSFEEFLRSRNDNSTGNPAKWTRYKNNLILYKSIPNGTARTIEVYYIKRLSKMTAEADVFPLNDEWIYPTEELATAIMFSRLKQFDASAAHYQAYQFAIGKRDTPEMVDQEAPEGGFMFISNPVTTRS